MKVGRKQTEMKSDWILAAVWLVHLSACPFTKVEESFNVQAMHDMLFHQFNISQYDHLEFPGVVPRTFVGAVFTCIVAYPFIFVFKLLDVSKYYALIAVRASLALILFACFRFFNKAVRKKFDSKTANWLVLITCCQFHFNFYASRPLPNTFALALVLLVFGCLMSDRLLSAVWLAVFSAAVFRSELVLLYGPLFIPFLISRRLKITDAILHGLISSVFSLVVTVLVDSYFWGRWLWPEGTVWYYNVILNKSANWGTSPFFWYFYSALPRALLFSLPLSIIGGLADRKVRTVFLSVCVFILLYSFLPHKELRFIMYTVPIFNLAAARACCVLLSRPTMNRFMNGIFRWGVFGHLMFNCIFALMFLYISANNYPGGFGILKVHEIRHDRVHLRMHIDVYSAQTGVSRFLHLKENWEYNKSETLKPDDDAYGNFDCFMVGGEKMDKTIQLFKHSHKVVSFVNSYKSFRPTVTRRYPYVMLNLQFSNNVAVICR